MDVKQSLLKNILIRFILLTLFMLLTTPVVMAANATLRWDPNDPAPDGYQVFARKRGQAYNYSQPAWVGATVSCTIHNLDDQTDYYFVVRAFKGGLTSADSAEVHFNSPASTPVTIEDSTPPSWNGATTGIGLLRDNGTGGSVTVAFDTAIDGIDRTGLKFNVYYATTGSWVSSDWTRNSVVVDAATQNSSTFTHAVTVSGLRNDVRYTFGVRVEDQSGNEDTNSRTMTAIPTDRSSAGVYNLMVSTKPDRLGPVFLEDAGVEGDIYVFVMPTEGIQRVDFLIDGRLTQTENIAPYDLAGGASNQANPFNTNSLGSGYHTFSAHITKTNGSSETISADVHLYEAGSESEPAMSPAIPEIQSVYTQWVSTAENRSWPDALDGSTVSDRIYVFVEPITDIRRVEFLIDGKLQQSESYAPYDLAGGTSRTANPFNTIVLKNGLHSFSARITKTNGTSETITADVSVENILN